MTKNDVNDDGVDEQEESWGEGNTEVDQLSIVLRACEVNVVARINLKWGMRAGYFVLLSNDSRSNLDDAFLRRCKFLLLEISTYVEALLNTKYWIWLQYYGICNMKFVNHPLPT